MRNHIYYFDWLRVLATITVVTIHVAAGYVTTFKPDQELLWFIANFFETISRWAVPVFVMISGALLLRDQREMTYWEFLKKRASKVIVPFVGCSALFYIYGVIMHYYPLSIKEATKLFLTNGISGHFWFFYMIIGIYLTAPLLKVFVKHASKRQIEYFLILWFYASFITKLSSFLFAGITFSLELNFVTNYVGYFLLGYYLYQFEIKKFWRRLSYVGLLVGLFGTYFLTYFYTIKQGGQLNQFWYSYFSPNVLFCAVGLFVLFRYNLNKPIPTILTPVNKASLGIYIIHYWLLNNYLWRVFPVVQDNFHQALVVPINILITLILSTVIVLILQRIPLVKKLVP